MAAFAGRCLGTGVGGETGAAGDEVPEFGMRGVGTVKAGEMSLCWGCECHQTAHQVGCAQGESDSAFRSVLVELIVELAKTALGDGPARAIPAQALEAGSVVCVHGGVLSRGGVGRATCVVAQLRDFNTLSENPERGSRFASERRLVSKAYADTTGPVPTQPPAPPIPPAGAEVSGAANSRNLVIFRLIGFLLDLAIVCSWWLWG